MERLGNAGLKSRFSFYYGLVYARPAGHVVALDREELLQGVRGAVGLEGPDLHLAEPLAAELGLHAERLLGDEGIRPYGAGVYLVVHEVVELEHVHIAYRHGPLERLARPP